MRPNSASSAWHCNNVGRSNIGCITRVVQWCYRSGYLFFPSCFINDFKQTKSMFQKSLQAKTLIFYHLNTECKQIFIPLKARSLTFKLPSEKLVYLSRVSLFYYSDWCHSLGHVFDTDHLLPLINRSLLSMLVKMKVLYSTISSHHHCNDQWSVANPCWNIATLSLSVSRVIMLPVLSSTNPNLLILQLIKLPRTVIGVTRDYSNIS